MSFLKKRNTDVPRRRQIVEEPIETIDISRRYARNRNLSSRPTQDEEAVSERSRAHTLIEIRRKVGLALLVVLVIVGVGFGLLSQFTGKVSVGASSATNVRLNLSEYEEAINQYLAQHPVERFRFVLNQSNLDGFVHNLRPEVAGVTQTGDWGLGVTHFTVTLRKPIAAWQINGKQYYVDDEGVAFDKNYFAEPSVKITDEAGAAFQVGATVTSTRFLSFVGKLVAQAKEKGMIITEAILPLGTTREVAVKVSDRPYQFRLSIDRGAGEQVEDMDRVEEYLLSRGLNPSYVDLRVSGRAFYQ